MRQRRPSSRQSRECPFLLDATAKDALGDERGAARSVERALDLAEHEGLLDRFICVPVRELLHRHSRTGTKHASLIVDILSIYTGSPRSSSRTQSEPLEQKLSDSELRVLRYLPTNLRAPEIAGISGRPGRRVAECAAPPRTSGAPERRPHCWSTTCSTPVGSSGGAVRGMSSRELQRRQHLAGPQRPVVLGHGSTPLLDQLRGPRDP